MCAAAHERLGGAMRILQIWDSEYPWDVRVEKISKSLIQVGHEVHLVCRNRTRQIREESIDGLHVHRLPRFGSSSESVRSVLSFPLFCNPVWVNEVYRIIRKVCPDVILVRDLPLAPLAIWMGKIVRRPVVLDMAENYPLMLEAVRDWERRRIWDYIVRNPTLAYWVEKWVLQHVDHVIVVIEESRDRLRALGVPDDRISIVCNTPVRGINELSYSLPPEQCFRDERSLILIYSGLTNQSRGLDLAVKAMAIVVKLNPHVKLVVIGKGKHDPEINRLILQYGLQDHVFAKGWVEEPTKNQYLQHSHVGIIPYRCTSHWNTTIPNKLFDYMSMKKMVIASNIIPTSRIIREEGCGLIFDCSNVEHLADTILTACDVRLRNGFGQRGYEAVQRRYHWETDAERLLRVFDML